MNEMDSVCGLFEYIEREFDVNSIICSNFMIWPLVRLNLWRKFVSNYEKRKSRKASFDFTWSQIDFPGTQKVYSADSPATKHESIDLIYWRKENKNLQLHENKRPIDFLFFSRVEDHNDYYNGNAYNRFVDPIIELILNDYNYLKFEFYSEYSKSVQPRRIEPIYIDPSPFYSACFQDAIVRVSGKEYRIDTVNEILCKIAGLHTFFIANNIQMGMKKIAKQIIRIKRNEIYFIEFLTEIRPKVIILSRVFNEYFLALIMAAKKLNIPCVEILHGFVNSYNAKYSHWTRIPKNGYELLPDYFWCWSEKDRDFILNSNCNNEGKHQPIIGGNPWAMKWRENNDFVADLAQSEYLKYIKQYRKIVLFSYVPIESPIPEILIDAMKESASDYLWLIRLHPNYSEFEDIKSIKLLLKKNGIINFEIEKATIYPLYWLLKNCHHHVSCSSSVCVDATVFSVSSTIIHPCGFEKFKNFINLGIFQSANSAHSLLCSIERGANVKIEPLIEYRKTAAMSALHTVLS